MAEPNTARRRGGLNASPRRAPALSEEGFEVRLGDPDRSPPQADTVDHELPFLEELVDRAGAHLEPLGYALRRRVRCL